MSVLGRKDMSEKYLVNCACKQSKEYVLSFQESGKLVEGDKGGYEIRVL